MNSRLIKYTLILPLCLLLVWPSQSHGQSEKYNQPVSNTEGNSSSDKNDDNRLSEDDRLAPRLVLSVFAGAWIPDGNLAVFGSHPKVGLKTAFRGNKLEVGVEVSHKFRDSKSFIEINRYDMDILSDNFSSWYFGFESRYNVMEKKSHSLDLIAGIGVSTIEFLAIDLNRDRTPDVRQNTTSYNFNAGIGYRYFVSDKFFVGFRTKYNFVNFDIPNGSDIAGNALTFSVSLGRMGYTTLR